MLRDRATIAKNSINVPVTNTTSLSKEELMRRRDQKALAKSEQSIGSNNASSSNLTVEHKCRRGERYWSDVEHERFLEAIRLFGKNWGEITRHVATRSRQSVYSHA